MFCAAKDSGTEISTNAAPIFVPLMNARLLLLICLFSACREARHSALAPPTPEQAPATQAPAPNKVVASARQRINDKLNEHYFSVEVISTPKSDKGVYEVLVTYRKYDASTQITMPKADEPIIPEVKKGTAPYSYIIGFHHGSDSSFKEYFLIEAERNSIKMRYLKAYSFK